MADLGGYPIQIQTEETKEMQLKWIAVRKQEAKSQITRLTQDIEDLKQAKIIELERAILHAQQTFDKLTKVESELKSK